MPTPVYTPHRIDSPTIRDSQMSYCIVMDLYTPTIGISFDANQFSDALDALLMQDSELQHTHADHCTHFAPTPVHRLIVENGTMETGVSPVLAAKINPVPSSTAAFLYENRRHNTQFASCAIG